MSKINYARTFERIRTEPGLFRNTAMTLALIVVALIVGSIILSQQRFIAPWESRYVIYATFEASPGVSPGQGQEVRIAGVQVGQIVDATVDDNGKPRLELSIEKTFEGRIYDNASLVMRPKSPLNEMYIVMNPGGPPGRPLPSGAVLPIANTARPIQIDEVLGHLDDNARTALTSLLAESDIALANAQRTLPPGLDGVRTVGNNLRPVAEELEKRKEKLRALTTALGQIAQAVGGDDGRLQTLANGLESTLGTLRDRDDQLDSTLNQLPDLLAQLRSATSAVQGLSDQLDPTLRNLEEASDEFPKALEALEDTSDRLDDVVDAAGPFVKAAEKVVGPLKHFTHEARSAVPALHAATRELDPITGALMKYLPDVPPFIIQTRSIVSATDANTGILRGQLYESGQTVPTLFGIPNNGLKPVPAPAVDKGTTQVQELVPTGPEGEPAPRQDGSEAPEGNPQQTPGEDDNTRKLIPTPPSGPSGGLLPLPKN